ncbi:unnamed protein product [Mytilus edulis]|uniref:Uncharacterized protein n=1 Tax=Mytilus edulis TaxID=6550 RepID=A0A8S3QN83_MYTED|nr:unnamed protein product [Mytilus edulis]
MTIYAIGSLNIDIIQFIELACILIIIILTENKPSNCKGTIMAVASLNHIELEFSKTGQRADGIPNNPKAKLMYYLKSMCYILQLDQTEHDIKRFTYYKKKYYSLSNEETAAMVLFCTMLYSVTLNDVCIFPDEEACGNSQNEFFKIEANRCRIAATRSVMVGNVQVGIKEFISYKRVWIE